MDRWRMAVLVCAIGCLVGFSVGAEKSARPDGEQVIWDLEQVYWRYVQANDLESYRSLWHKEFVGWPAVSAAPVRKEHITDWITSQTAQGRTFEFIELKPAAIQMHGDLAVVYYWSTYKWVDNNGVGAARRTRVTHTWVRNGKDWQIVGGMSLVEGAAEGR